MNRFQLLLVSTAILSLVSCGDPKGSAPGISAMQAPVTAKSSASGFTALKGVVAKTTAAVGSDQFDKAKSEFEKFELSWKTVEDGVQATSSDTYNAVEDSLDTVTGEFKLKQPNKTKVLAALKSLRQSLKMADQP